MFRRLRQGQREYGDRSFSRAPAELVDEIRQELLDVCAWSYILAVRLDLLQARTAVGRQGAAMMTRLRALLSLVARRPVARRRRVARFAERACIVTTDPLPIR